MATPRPRAGAAVPLSEWAGQYQAGSVVIGQAPPLSAGGHRRRSDVGLPADVPAGHSGVATMAGAVANLTKGIVGAGILAVPNGFRGSSIVVGVLGLVGTGFLSAMGFLAIGRACMLTGSTTYREAWVAAGGSAAAVDTVIILEVLLTCMGYTVLIGDYACTGLHGLFPSLSTFLSREMLVAVLTMLVILPLCLIGELQRLSKTSALGLLAIFYAFVYVVGDGVAHGTVAQLKELDWFAVRSETFPAVTTFVAAYVGHFLAPAIWAECLETAGNEDRAWVAFRRIVFSSYSLVCSGYIVFGIAGYAVFGTQVHSNILTNYPAVKDGAPVVWTLLCWLLMSIAMAFSYPLIFRSARDTAAIVLDISMYSMRPFQVRVAGSAMTRPSSTNFEEARSPELRNSHGVDAVEGDAHDHIEGPAALRRRVGGMSAGDASAATVAVAAGSKCSSKPCGLSTEQLNWQWAALVVAMVVVTNAWGAYLDNIGWLFAIRGAVLACPLCFVLPGMMLLRCKETPSAWRCGAKVLFLCGIVFGVLGSYFAR